MSTILSRHLKIRLPADKFLSLPQAQILYFRFDFEKTRNQDRIEIRLSIGHVTFFGANLTAFWEELASGECREFGVGRDVAPQCLEAYVTDLAAGFLTPSHPLAESI